jgi:thioredoxin 1
LTACFYLPHQHIDKSKYIEYNKYNKIQQDYIFPRDKELVTMMAPITGTANIDKVLTEGDVILGFSAPWCGYCRRLRPMVEKLSGEIETPIYGINVDEDEEIAKRYEVETIPTLIYFHEGKPVNRIIGYGNVGYNDLKSFVEKASE